MIFRCVFRPYFIILSHDYSIVHTFLSSICCMVYLIKSRFLRISTVKRKLFHYTTYNAHITSQYLLSTRFFNFSSSFFFLLSCFVCHFIRYPSTKVTLSKGECWQMYCECGLLYIFVCGFSFFHFRIVALYYTILVHHSILIFSTTSNFCRHCTQF